MTAKMNKKREATKVGSFLIAIIAGMEGWGMIKAGDYEMGIMAIFGAVVVFVGRDYFKHVLGPSRKYLDALNEAVDKE